MKNTSYARKTIVNSITGIISYSVVMISTMVVRIVFSHYLSKELLGLNSLYSSILDLLLISELGIATAMVVFLYEPVQLNDKKTIKLVMNYYAKLYKIFCFVLFVLGILVLFFVLPYIVNVTTINEKEYKIYFFLFLIGTLTSYLFAHLKSLFYASQQNFIVTMANAIQRLIISILQCFIIIQYKDFFLFLIIRIIGNIIENICLRFIVIKQFPYIKEKCKEEIDEQSKHKIAQIIKPVFITQVADKVLSQTDTILINKFINIIVLGIFSNYNIIIAACKGVFSPIGGALTTSYGGLSVNKSPQQKYEAFLKSYPFAHLTITLICSFFITYIQDFIKIAFGDSFLLSNKTCLIFTLYLYLDLLKTIFYSYQNALGLQKLDQRQMLLQVPFNIIISIILGYKLGLDGIILGTIITLLVFPVRYKGYIIYKKVFCVKSGLYFKKILIDSSISFIILIILFLLTNHFIAETILHLVLKVIIFILIIISLNVLAMSINNYKVFIEFLKRKCHILKGGRHENDKKNI